MVLRDNYCPVSKGWCSAWSAAWPAPRSFGRTWEVDTAIVDPWVVLLVPIPLVLAAFCACYLPVSRAANVDPNVALRQRRRIERDRQWSV